MLQSTTVTTRRNLCHQLTGISLEAFRNLLPAFVKSGDCPRSGSGGAYSDRKWVWSASGSLLFYHIRKPNAQTNQTHFRSLYHEWAKVFQITCDAYRDHRSQYKDLVMEMACGLHNRRLIGRLPGVA
jgi:hypothetical protein